MTKHTPGKNQHGGINTSPGGASNSPIDYSNDPQFQLAVQAAMAVQAAASSASQPPTASIGAVGALNSVNSVAVKLPGFWKDNPSGWFRQAESAFRLRHPPITAERTRYDHVVTALDSKTSLELSAVMDNPPVGGEYTALKAALMLTFDQTQMAKDTELMSITSLGDLKATAMLRRMTRLATPGSVETNIFRHSFLSVLPTDVRAILANEDGTLAELAVKADRVIEARGATASTISSVSSPPTQDPGLAALAQEVAAIRQSLSGSRSNGGGGRNRPSRSSGADNVFVCNNHAKWGRQAFSCKPNCSFAGLPLASPPGNGNASR